MARYWRDIAWQASGNSLAQLVGVAGIPVMTRLYAPEDFSVQSLFIQLVTFATAVVTWRFEYFVQLPKADEEARSLNGLVLILGASAVLVLTPLLWLYGDGIALQMGNRGLARWLALVPVTAVLVSWAMATQNTVQRHGDFKISGLSELAGKITYVSTAILGAVAQLGLAGLMLTTALAAVGKTVFVLARRPVWAKQPFKVDRHAMHCARLQYGRLATSTVFSHMLTTSAIAVPQIALARLYGAGVLGQFALVLATIYLPSGLLGAAIGQVYYHRAAQHWAEGKTFYLLWRSTARKLLLIGVPVYILAAALGRYAYPFIFGGQWHLAGEFASWVAVAAFGSFVSSPMDRTCLVVGAWLYSILWSLCRVASALVVAWLAWSQKLTPMGFVIALTVQMCIAYGIDFWMGYRFSQGRVGVLARG